MNFLLTLILSLSGTLGGHNFHVSITNGELNPKTETLQLYMKVFMDDLEDGIKSSTNKALNLDKPNVLPQADTLISNYILGRFSVKANGQKLNFRYIGKEIEQDIVFVYLEVPVKPTVKELAITNTLFFDRFDDQSNIVNIEVRGEVESAFLEKSNPTRTLHFD